VPLLRELLGELTELLDEHGIDLSFTMNGLLTDGEWIVANCYISDEGGEANTLYNSVRGTFDFVDGKCRILPKKPENDYLLVGSEKLMDTKKDGHSVPANHLVLVESDLSINSLPITL
tara:strand:- start:1105 stop:1458 length:354 start_codon:yes stop_codon:yes gene_type:complete